MEEEGSTILEKLTNLWSPEDNASWEQKYTESHVPFSLRELMADWIENDSNWLEHPQEVYSNFICSTSDEIGKNRSQKIRLNKELKELKAAYDSNPLGFVKIMVFLVEKEKIYLNELLTQTGSMSSSTTERLTREFVHLREKCQYYNQKLQEQVPHSQPTNQMMFLPPSECLVKSAGDKIPKMIDEIFLALCRWRLMKNYPARNSPSEDINSFEKVYTEAHNCVQDFSLCCMNLAEMFSAEKCQYYDELRQLFCNEKRRLFEKSFIVMEMNSQIIKIAGGRKEEDDPRRRQQPKHTKEGKAQEPINIKIRCLLPALWLSSPEATITVHRLDKSNPKEQPLVDISQKKFKLEQSSSSDGAVGIACNNWGNTILYTSLIVDRAVQSSEHLWYLSFKYPYPCDGAMVAEVHSNPIGFITHTSYISKLCGVILWYNAFTPVLDPCKVNPERPRSVPWNEMSVVLDLEFHSEKSLLGHSIRERGGNRTKVTESVIRFNEFHKRCLSELLEVGTDKADAVVTYEKFNTDAKFRCRPSKTKKPDTKHTFSEFFYACYKTKKNMPLMYEKGLFYGFIKKCALKPNGDAADDDDTAQLLLVAGEGSFILRFSTNHMAKADMAHVTVSMFNPKTHKIEHIYPVTSDRYADNENIANLLPTHLKLSPDQMKVLKVDHTVETFEDAFRGLYEEHPDFSGYQTASELMEYEGGSSNPSTPASSIGMTSPPYQQPGGPLSNLSSVSDEHGQRIIDPYHSEDITALAALVNVEMDLDDSQTTAMSESNAAVTQLPGINTLSFNSLQQEMAMDNTYDSTSDFNIVQLSNMASQ